MSIFRQPYERHDHKGGLDSCLVYYLLTKYGRKGEKWLDQFGGGDVIIKVGSEIGITITKISLDKGEDARELPFVEGEFDGVICHPPYWKAIKYSEDKRDLSAIKKYEDYLKELEKALNEAIRVLKTGGKLIVIIGDYRKEGVLYPIHSDVIQLLKKKKELILRDYIIWELSATGTALISTKWMIMANFCLIWEKKESLERWITTP